MEKAPALLALRRNNVPMSIDSVRNADDFDSDWQSPATTSHGSAYVAGMNIVGFPTTLSGSITATVVQNAPVPAVVGDFLQVGRDVYDAVMDYAQHISFLKSGGSEFAETLPLLQNFLREAGRYNAALANSGFFQKTMYESSQLERERNP
jgi:hypothetical protein